MDSRYCDFYDAYYVLVSFINIEILCCISPQIITPTGEEYLVSMPTKFRKNIWVKRGDYILVEPIEEGDKVKAEIVKIMNKDSIKYYKENNIWPKEFDDNKKNTDENKDDLFVNTNRAHMKQYHSDTDSSDDSDRDSDSDDVK